MCHPAVYIGLAGLNMIQARQAYKAEQALAEQAFRDREDQIQENRESVYLESIQKGNILKQNFIEKQASNRALLSPSGIGQSNSFEAAMASNKDAYMQELNVNALNAIRKNSELAYASQESALTKLADINQAKSRFAKSMMDSIEMGAYGFQGLKKKPSSTGGSIGRTSVRKVGVPGDAGFGPSPNPLTGFRY